MSVLHRPDISKHASQHNCPVLQPQKPTDVTKKWVIFQAVSLRGHVSFRGGVAITWHLHGVHALSLPNEGVAFNFGRILAS